MPILSNFPSGISDSVQQQIDEVANKICKVNLSVTFSDNGTQTITCDQTVENIVGAENNGAFIFGEVTWGDNKVYTANYIKENGFNDIASFIFSTYDAASDTEDGVKVAWPSGYRTYILTGFNDGTWTLSNLFSPLLSVISINDVNCIPLTFTELFQHCANVGDITAIEFDGKVYTLSHYDQTGIRFSQSPTSGDYLFIHNLVFEPNNKEPSYGYAAFIEETSELVSDEIDLVKESMSPYINVHMKLSDTVKNKLNCAIGTNLMRNWYFGRPVNQRGQTTYTGLGYGIDQWKADSVTPNVTTIKDGYIELSQNALIAQILEEPYSLCGKQVTASALTTTGLYTFTATIPSKDTLSSVTANKNLGNIHFMVDGNDTGYVDMLHTVAHSTMFRLRAFEGYTVGVIAVKLELGSVQTLAHQDTDGNWVLNEIPDYNMELMKCQRYFQVIASPYESTGNGVAIGYANNTADFWVDFNLPIPMRTSPVASIPDITLFKLGKTSGSQKDITKATGGWATRNNDSCNMRSIIFTSSGLTAGENYVLFMKNGAKMTLSAEL